MGRRYAIKPEIRDQLKQSAQEAAEMNSKVPGSGYAYVMGFVKAIAESKFTKNADKVEQIRIFLQEFDRSKNEKKDRK